MKVSHKQSLVRYSAMLVAIEQCHQVDEIKVIHDKALAIGILVDEVEVKVIRDQAQALGILEACNHTFWFPPLPGVYVFDGLDGVLYVGESRNLRKRLACHSRGYLRRSTGVRCRIIPCRNHKQVERWLIAALQPSLNGVSEQRRRMREDKRDKKSFSELWDALFGDAGYFEKVG